MAVAGCEPTAGPLETRHAWAVAIAAVAVVALGLPGVAAAQRVSFERSYDVAENAVIDVSTVRGKIDVRVGEPGRIDVRGDVTVRSGFGVPANAPTLARQVAADPPIVQEGGRLRATALTGELERALTIRYELTVPPDTTVTTRSDSGATTVRGVAGRVDVETGSAAIEMDGLGGPLDVRTRSGAVRVDGVAGDATVRTDSSAIRLRHVGAGLQARTESGSVEVELDGQGDVDVETGSSAIELEGIRGGLAVTTRSGRVRVRGQPGAEWHVRTESSEIELTLPRGSGLDLDARSETSDVELEGATLVGATTKGLATGTVGGGGPTVQLDSRSGRIRVRLR